MNSTASAAMPRLKSSERGLGKLDHGKNENEIEKALGKARLCLIRTFFPKPMPFVFSHVTPHNGRAEDI
jgi:hypothetical protein